MTSDRRRRPAQVLWVPMFVVTAIIAAGCGSTRAAAPAPSQIYVSLGDSYAAGFQPTGAHTGTTNRNGFAYQVVGLAAKRGYTLHLANFGCGGATTVSLTAQKGCHQLGPAGIRYPKQSQLAAALAYLKAHKGHITLVTMSLGGNDVTSCAKATDVVGCVTTAVGHIKTNLGAELKQIRAAVGPRTLIVGTTYPDVILGSYLDPSPSAQTLAKLSVTAFQSLINPALGLVYQAVGGTLVDVTTATGAYTPLTDTTSLAPYGTIPLAVAKVCELTYYCLYKDIHPKTAGYTIIAKLVADELPEK